MIRWVTPVRHFMRQAQEDYALRGTQLAAGDWLMMSYLSANRDEDVFADPMRFDVARANADEHLAFGIGVHFCLGAHLARMELRAFFRELLPRLEYIELAGRPGRWRRRSSAGRRGCRSAIACARRPRRRGRPGIAHALEAEPVRGRRGRGLRAIARRRGSPPSLRDRAAARPISTSVPAMLRTMWRRKLRPSAAISDLVAARRVTSSRWSVRRGIGSLGAPPARRGRR